MKTLRQIPCFGMALALLLTLGVGATASAAPFFFSTGNPDGRMAAASRPESPGKIEIEAADDFILTSRTVLHQAIFTGLLLHEGPGEIREVRVEIYRVFPKDSKDSRTPQVPTRKNSPADVALADRSTADGNLQFTARVLKPRFRVANSVINGIHPGQQPADVLTGGEGPVAGQKIQFHVVFEEPLDLPPDHYFFIPQVQLQGQGGNFLWLSAPHPQFANDLQMWIRNADLDPDWLRVGTDIVGGTTFDGSFSLIGETVP